MDQSPTAEDLVRAANQAFYDAHEHRNMAAMADIWEQSVRAVCVHPGWPILRGWEAVGGVPDAPEAVIIAAPHTSNWDAVWAIAFKLAVGLDLPLQTVFAALEPHQADPMIEELVMLLRSAPPDFPLRQLIDLIRQLLR